MKSVSKVNRDIERSTDTNEWPQAGDTVLFTSNPLTGCKVECTVSFVSGKHIILIDNKGREYSRRKEKVVIEKPEEDFRCELWDLISETISRDSDIDSIVTDIMNDYTLTKKPD